MAGRLAAFLLTFALPAAAQLSDPTRPPAFDAASGEMGVAAASDGGLQSVILRQNGRPAALINGEVVELGAKLGDARLVKVNEDSVVLLGPAGRETLRLMPAAEKKMKVGAGGTAKSIGMNAIKGEPRK